MMSTFRDLVEGTYQLDLPFGRLDIPDPSSRPLAFIKFMADKVKGVLGKRGMATSAKVEVWPAKDQLTVGRAGRESILQVRNGFPVLDGHTYDPTQVGEMVRDIINGVA